MKKESNIQNAMFQEMKDKSIFDKTQSYAYQYLDQAFDRNIFPTEKALNGLDKFDEELPFESSEAIQVIDLLNRYGSPATVSQIGGRYFGFVNGGIIPTGLAAKNLATYWDQNTGMRVISPIASKLESVVEEWLIKLLNLPVETVAGFVSGTSSANFCGLAAARYKLLKRLDWDINEKGLFNAPKLRIVAGKQAHSTILKAIGLLGFGKENIEWVDVDKQGRMIPESIPQLDEKSVLILQAGNVNSGSFDFFEEICNKAKTANSWVHIDGAFGLWAGAVEKLKHLTKGMEGADSWAVDGHKTLNTPYDCGIVLCKDKNAIVSALHMSASYIITSEERDGMFYTPEMSRRARIVELWATMKYLGKIGINQMVFGLHQRAVQFAEEISQVDGFEVLNDVVFNQVLVSCESDELTEKTIERIQELQECWVGGSTWNSRKVIRISVCSWATTSDDISISVKSFKKALTQVKKEIY
jgi:glutamate/tyrosine decarboxylase-like PLP-dependent enzyme